MSCGTCSGAGMGKLGLPDVYKGLIVAVIGAFVGGLYEFIPAIFKGGAIDLVLLQKTMVSALGLAIGAALTYLLKNLGTGTGGQFLSNKPKEEVKDVPKT